MSFSNAHLSEWPLQSQSRKREPFENQNEESKHSTDSWSGPNSHWRGILRESIEGRGFCYNGLVTLEGNPPWGIQMGTRILVRWTWGTPRTVIPLEIPWCDPVLMEGITNPLLGSLTHPRTVENILQLVIHTAVFGRRAGSTKGALDDAHGDEDEEAKSRRHGALALPRPLCKEHGMT